MDFELSVIISSNDYCNLYYWWEPFNFILHNLLLILNAFELHVLHSAVILKILLNSLSSMKEPNATMRFD